MVNVKEKFTAFPKAVHHTKHTDYMDYKIYAFEKSLVLL